MKLDLAFAVSLLLGAFGVVTMWMAQGRHPTRRKFAPIVGLVAQVAWSWYAWLLGPKAGGLWILVALYAAVYVHGVWIHWDLRRWLWRRFGDSRNHHCVGCGRRLTADEQKYFSHWCERCEVSAMERLGDAA